MKNPVAKHLHAAGNRPATHVDRKKAFTPGIEMAPANKDRMSGLREAALNFDVDNMSRGELIDFLEYASRTLELEGYTMAELKTGWFTRFNN